MQAVKHHNRQFIRGIGIVDETSCGPLCQHPACWRANERLEKGLPNISPPKATKYGHEDDLPVVTVYNMLEDYGESPKDLYPGGQPAQDHTKQQLPRTLLPLTKHKKTLATCPANSPHLSDSPQAISAPPKKSAVAVKNVEVQEVFDLEDLSNTWEQTFLAKQYYVWVPNPNWKPRSAQASLEAGRSCSGPRKITPRDMTEELIPRCIEDAREANFTRRHTQNRSRSPYRYFSSSPRQPGLDEVDIEGINELLDLPREVLMKVLDHCQPSDLRCREKILTIVQRFMPGYQTSPTRKPSARNEVLKQSKVQLHDGKLKNVRQPTAMVGCQPVFQLDQFVESELKQPDSNRNREFSKYRHALPAIGTRAGSLDNFKMSSVSLGLPELPSGVRTTRAFNYTNLGLDFTLGPSIPLTERSTITSEGNRSDHGTTINVNIPSHRSETTDMLMGRGETNFREAHNSGPESLRGVTNLPPAERFICPDPPLGTPMSMGLQRSLTKSSGFRREVTMDSVEEEGSEARPTPTLEKERRLVSAVHIPTESSASSVTQPDSPGVIHKASPISPRSIKKSSGTRQGVLFHKEVPPQPPSSPQSGPAEMSSLSPVPTVTPLATVLEQDQEAVNETEQTPLSKRYGLAKELQGLAASNRSSPVSSVDAWPTDVVENSFSTSRAETQASELLPMTPETLNSTAVGFDACSEKSRLTSIPQSEVSSRLSDPSFVKTKLAHKSSRESPGPPPPSPEPKDIDGSQLVRRFSGKSRDSFAMAPVFEEGEESADDDVSISASPPKNLFDSHQFVSGFSTNRETEEEGGSESPLKRISAQVDIDMEQDRDRSREDNCGDHSQEHSNNAKSNQNFSNACGEFFDEYPTCPPETDGRSSTYLTDRDRRFSPEGLDTPLDIAGVLYTGENCEEDAPQDDEESMAGGCIMDEDDDDEFSEADVEMNSITGDVRDADTEADPIDDPSVELDPKTSVPREPENHLVGDTEAEGIGLSLVGEGVRETADVESVEPTDGLARNVQDENMTQQLGEAMMVSEDLSSQNEGGAAERALSTAVGQGATDSLERNLADGAYIIDDKMTAENASPLPTDITSVGQDSGQESAMQITDDANSNNQNCTDELKPEEKVNEGGQEPSAHQSGGVEVSVSVPQTPSVATGGADDSDIGHVTPMYTETSDRASGRKTVTKPAEGHPSYIN